MKLFKIQKVISIICSGLGFVFSLLGLIYGLQSIGTAGWGGIGVIFILPSIIACLNIMLDFFVTIGKIKKGLIYSCISTLIKTVIIIVAISNTIHEYKYELQYGVSNLDFDLILIIALIVITIPSILNTIRLFSLRKGIILIYSLHFVKEIIKLQELWKDKIFMAYSKYSSSNKRKTHTLN